MSKSEIMKWIIKYLYYLIASSAQKWIHYNPGYYMFVKWKIFVDISLYEHCLSKTINDYIQNHKLLHMKYTDNYNHELVYYEHWLPNVLKHYVNNFSLNKMN